MSHSFKQCSLFLCPDQHDYSVDDISDLISKLKDIGFIADRITDKQNAYLTGDRFLNYIAYMGCAPSIQFEASDDNGDDDSSYCYVKFHQYDPARLIHDRSRCRAPHCPRCKKMIDDWREQISEPELYCSDCESHSAIETIEWRKMAGYARLFIEITDVFPKEAIPQTLLLDFLAGISDNGWRYFYRCQ